MRRLGFLTSCVYIYGMIKKIKVMVLSEKKVGDEFYMDGLSYPDNNPVKTVCTLIEYRGMNKYVVDTEDCLVLCDGDDKVYNKK